MFKRLFWFSVGAGSSLWIMRAVRQRISQYAPERIADNVASAAKSAREDLRTALIEGRAAMREREASLRAEFDAPG